MRGLADARKQINMIWRDKFMQEQYKPKMFRVNYQTERGEGCIMVYVGNFFLVKTA